jgi:pseudouridine-5'-phosphate glycosidase
VREALQNHLPVVALESTIITHGMPHPANLETAQRAEQEVRDAGATPATIALMDGRIKVGLRGRELERLAGEAGTARKCSLRDLALVLASGETGGTTVAATLHIARQVGIRVFATGGIGGVHRGAPHTLDISADLMELARAPLAVVCAGPKAILDLALTLEFLETQGVPVLGYGTGELPAFWSRDSGFPVDARADTPQAVARVLDAQRELGLGSGLLVCNPVPEAFALSRETVEAHIEAALAEARRQGIGGKELTPFLLAQVTEASGGESLAANRALMAANARLAAEVAVALEPRPPEGAWC